MPHPKDVHHPLSGHYEEMRRLQVDDYPQIGGEVRPAQAPTRKLFNVCMISSVGSELHVDTGLFVALSGEEANGMAIAKIKPGRLLQKVHAQEITRADVEAALRMMDMR